ncbi:helix-turn-helix domain-containing protein, partial [Serratia marcescens]|uniref:helix-turn-helix domain-containing protein n=3 Tax=Pseudomonadota TaxID=1224 RepID=UPI001353364E
DTVRFWAYEAIRAFISGSYDGWHREVLNVAINANGAFLEPLPYSEVKATAKSVSRWVWRNHTEAHAKFIKRQAERGRKGGLVSDSSHGGKARSSQYSDIRQEALKLHIQGVNNTQIAELLKVNRRTIIRWLQGVTVQA